MSEKEKIFAIVTVARQIDGEYVFIKTEKGFRKASDAEALLKKLKSEYTLPDGKPKPVELSTAQGSAMCHYAVGAFDLEID